MSLNIAQMRPSGAFPRTVAPYSVKAFSFQALHGLRVCKRRKVQVCRAQEGTGSRSKGESPDAREQSTRESANSATGTWGAVGAVALGAAIFVVTRQEEKPP